MANLNGKTITLQVDCLHSHVEVPSKVSNIGPFRLRYAWRSQRSAVATSPAPAFIQAITASSWVSRSV